VANDKLEIEGIQDMVAAMQQLAQAFTETRKNMRAVSDSTTSWNKILNMAVLKIKDLPGHIGNSRDLWKEMTKDADLFKKVQTDVIDMVEKKWLEDIDKAKKKYGETHEKVVAFKKAHEQVRVNMKDQFDLAKKLLANQREKNVELGNANKLAKDLGGYIRSPSQGIDKLLGSLGKFPNTLKKAREETDSWSKAFKLLAQDGIEKVVGPLKSFLGPGGWFLLGTSVAIFAVTALYALFVNYYEFLDKKVMPATAAFNKQIGGSGSAVGQLKSQMISTGVQFELLGLSFEEGTKLVRDFSESFKQVEISNSDLKTAKDLIAVVGLTAKEAGQMALQFSKQEGGLDGLRTAFSTAERAAANYGLPVNAVLRDLGSAPDVLARFGTKNAIEFAKATVKANSYGMSIKDINQAFGEQFDTFDKSAEAAANLNTIFGTNINSYDLMLESNPIKRLEMVRKELIKNGKSWNDLSVKEQNVITQNLGVSKSQAALILSSGEQRRQLEAQAEAQDRLTKASETWDRGLGRIKETLIAWGPQIELLMRNVAELIAALFGLDLPDDIGESTEAINTAFTKVNATVKDWTASLKGAYKVFESLKEPEQAEIRAAAELRKERELLEQGQSQESARSGGVEAGDKAVAELKRLALNSTMGFAANEMRKEWQRQDDAAKNQADKQRLLHKTNKQAHEAAGAKRSFPTPTTKEQNIRQAYTNTPKSPTIPTPVAIASPSLKKNAPTQLQDSAETKKKEARGMTVASRSITNVINLVLNDKVLASAHVTNSLE
jgi:hypothetical protein